MNKLSAFAISSFILLFGVTSCESDEAISTPIHEEIELNDSVSYSQILGEWSYEKTLFNVQYGSFSYRERNSNRYEDYKVMLQFKEDSIRLYGFPQERFINTEVEFIDGQLHAKNADISMLSETSRLYIKNDTLILCSVDQFNLTYKIGQITANTYKYDVYSRASIDQSSLSYLDSCELDWTLFYDIWSNGTSNPKPIKNVCETGITLPATIDLRESNSSNFYHKKRQLYYLDEEDTIEYEFFVKRKNVLYLNYQCDSGKYLVQYHRR